MKRFTLVLLATAVLTSACALLEKPACGCSPPPTKDAADVATTFAGLVDSHDGAAAWRLLNDAARRHYRDESTFARDLPTLAGELGSRVGGGQSAANWKTINWTASAGGQAGTELVIPVLASGDTMIVGRLALPIDTGGDPMTMNDRVGIPVAATLAVDKPTQGSTARADRPTFTALVPEGAAVTFTLISGANPAATPELEHLTADVVRAGGRKTPDGYTYTWQPNVDPPAGRQLTPGTYVFAASAEREGRWTWNAVPVIIQP